MEESSKKRENTNNKILRSEESDKWHKKYFCKLELALLLLSDGIKQRHKQVVKDNPQERLYCHPSWFAYAMYLLIITMVTIYPLRALQTQIH